MASCSNHPKLPALYLIEKPVVNRYRDAPANRAALSLVQGVPPDKVNLTPLENRKVYVCAVCAGKMKETPEMKSHREELTGLRAEVSGLKDQLAQILAAMQAQAKPVSIPPVTPKP